MKKNNNNDLIFTPEELKELKFTEEELELFEDTRAIVETAETLPENPDKLLDFYNKKVPNDFEKALNALGELSKSNPKFVQDLLSMFYLMEDVEQEPAPEVQKVTLSDINAEKNDDLLNRLLAKL